MEKKFIALIDEIKKLRDDYLGVNEPFVDYIMSDAGKADIVRIIGRTAPWAFAAKAAQLSLTNRIRAVLVTHVYHDSSDSVTEASLLEVIQDEYKRLKKTEAERIIRNAMKEAGNFGVFLQIQCEGDKDIYLPPSSAYTASYKAGLLKK